MTTLRNIALGALIGLLASLPIVIGVAAMTLDSLMGAK